MTQILRLPFDQWPLEVFSALHLTLKKSAGDNVNVNTRPIKLLSALFRIQAKLYAPLIQLATAPSESGCRQYAGFKGSSAHALRRMLHTVITQSLAVRGEVTTMFLDFSGAFDEINRQAILRVADMYPFLCGVVHEVVHHYMSFRQYVVSALGLSESYCQVEGVLQGGGLDPLFYILAVNLIHLAMRQLGVGVPVCVPPSVEMIASLGYVDDTVGFSSIDDRQRVADHLRVIIDCVGQRNNSSKMNVQVLQVKQGSVCSVSKSVVWDDKPVWSTSRHQHIKFLGGNANILGGFPTIKKVITRWSRTVISRLRGWPVSVGVAHTVIEGLVVNRLVFRCCVNVPTDVQISSVTGSICRVYRLVFGLAPNTPRACIVSILGRAAPDHVLWVIVINELFKSLNGPNALLNLRGHTGRTRAYIALTATLSAFSPGSKAWAFSFANSRQVKGLSGV